MSVVRKTIFVACECLFLCLDPDAKNDDNEIMLLLLLNIIFKLGYTNAKYYFDH